MSLLKEVAEIMLRFWQILCLAFITKIYLETAYVILLFLVCFQNLMIALFSPIKWCAGISSALIVEELFQDADPEDPLELILVDSE